MAHKNVPTKHCEQSMAKKNTLSYGIKSKYYRLRKIYDCVKQ